MRIVRKSKGAVVPVLIPNDPVKMIDLKINECRWPVDTDDGILFCGSETPAGHSYCQHHKYQSVQHRKLKPIDEKHLVHQ